MVQQVRARNPRTIYAIRLSRNNIFDAMSMLHKDGFIFAATSRYAREHVSFANEKGSYLDAISVEFGQWIVYDNRTVDVLDNARFNFEYELVGEPTPANPVVAVAPK